ncbi:MAG: hypothetical protein ACRDD1_19600 [Planctomycetia bacterium]
MPNLTPADRDAVRSLLLRLEAALAADPDAAPLRRRRRKGETGLVRRRVRTWRQARRRWIGLETSCQRRLGQPPLSAAARPIFVVRRREGRAAEESGG